MSFPYCEECKRRYLPSKSSLCDSCLSKQRMNIWMQRYEEELRNAVREYPKEYAYDVSQVPKVAEKMRGAFFTGSFNKDSRAIRATCKYFKISHTYKAILSFLEGS